MSMFWIVMTFICGTGFGWCLCSLLYILEEYLDDKRDLVKDKLNKRTTFDLFMTHRMVRDNYTGDIQWVRDNRWYKKENKE